MNETASPGTPIPFPAVAAALEAINQSVPDAQAPTAATPHPPDSGPHPALAALLMLRKVREELAGWESALIETARGQGASWAELAEPIGVASRQAAERRYLRLRPGAAGSTGEERVQATRDTRAADRTVTAWARDNAADLRRLAAQITALTNLPDSAAEAVSDLNLALADSNAARLVGSLTGFRTHLQPEDTGLTERIEALTQHTDQLRQHTHDQRST